MGVVGRTETGIEGTTKTNAVNTAKIDAEDTAGMGAVGAVGVAVADTPTFAASPGPSKGFANERNGHTNKRGKVNLAKKKKKEGWGGRKHIPMNSSSLDSKILLLKTGSSSGSSRISSDSSEDKSASGPRVAEIGMEEGVTTKEELSFTA